MFNTVIFFIIGLIFGVLLSRHASFADPISSPASQKKVIFYSGLYLDGAQMEDGVGQKATIPRSFKIKSVKVPQGLRVSLFSRENFGGNRVYASSDSYLVNQNGKRTIEPLSYIIEQT